MKSSFAVRHFKFDLQPIRSLFIERDEKVLAGQYLSHLAKNQLKQIINVELRTDCFADAVQGL